MNKATAIALAGSIDKWEDILAGKVKDCGTENCPLCDIFWHQPGCRKCPVKVATGKSQCKGSPYEKWAIHQNSRELGGNRNADWATDKRSKKLAGDELAFLISLRPS